MATRLTRVGASVLARREARRRPRRAVRTEVVAVTRPTPDLVRVTLTGPGVAGFPVLGGDQYARLLLARPGQREPQLPVGALWYPELLAMADSVRPVLRNYTLRAVRPDRAEVDVDLVLHPGAGPATTWAAAARVGDVVGLVEQGLLHAPDPTADVVLLVADETGLPAVAGLLAQLPAAARVVAVVEVGSVADEQPLTGPGRLDLTWLHRGDRPPGVLALAHLPTVDLPPGRCSAWLAGEAAMATGLRRHLVHDRRLARTDVAFAGYYRQGRPQYA